MINKVSRLKYTSSPIKLDRGRSFTITSQITRPMGLEGFPISLKFRESLSVKQASKRKGLNHGIDWFFFVQEHSDNPVSTERYLREVEQKEEIHIEAFYSEYLFCQDTFYMGTIKGLG
jgi:hypothetical protein